MFRCKEHGEKEADWCDECDTLLTCDCSDMVSTRIKDVCYDSISGERTITIYIHHCETCGDPVSVEIK